MKGGFVCFGDLILRFGDEGYYRIKYSDARWVTELGNDKVEVKDVEVGKESAVDYTTDREHGC